MFFGKDSLSDLLRFCGKDIQVSELETVLWMLVDNKLNFENHIKSLCSKELQRI